MIFEGLMLAVGGALVAVARFSWWPARSYRTWWVALFATELGHIWVLFAVGLGWMGAHHGGISGAIVVVMATLAALGFLRPILGAARLAAPVTRNLAAVFPGPPALEKLWSWRRAVRWPLAVTRVPVHTESVCTPDGVELPVDIYRALGELADAPCVVLVHGGGWDTGDRTELARFNHWLAVRGVTVIAADYRLAPAHPWPAQRADLHAVIAWVRAAAPRLGINPDRLTLVGRSAGAQIALATAYTAPLPGVRAVVGLYGCYDLGFVWSLRSTTDSLNSDKLMHQYLGGGPEGREALYRSGSAEQLVHPDAPPTLLIHGALDELVWYRHSERLAAALTRVGGRHVLVRLPWATHAAEANLHGPGGQIITGAVWRVATANP